MSISCNLIIFIVSQWIKVKSSLVFTRHIYTIWLQWQQNRIKSKSVDCQEVALLLNKAFKSNLSFLNVFSIQHIHFQSHCTSDKSDIIGQTSIDIRHCIHLKWFTTAQMLRAFFTTNQFLKCHIRGTLDPEMQYIRELLHCHRFHAFVQCSPLWLISWKNRMNLRDGKTGESICQNQNK